MKHSKTTQTHTHIHKLSLIDNDKYPVTLSTVYYLHKLLLFFLWAFSLYKINFNRAFSRFFSLRNCCCRRFTFSRCLSFWGVDPLNGWANRCVFHSYSRTHLTNQHHMVYFFFFGFLQWMYVCTCTYSIVYLSLDFMHSTFEMSPVPFESGRMFNDCLLLLLLLPVVVVVVVFIVTRQINRYPKCSFQGWI